MSTQKCCLKILPVYFAFSVSCFQLIKFNKTDINRVIFFIVTV